MCGITAIISPDSEDLSRLGAMTDLLIHRGPDASGSYVGEGVALGHRRLSILDLSEAGTQPMSNETGEIKLVCNGEFYNYLDLNPGLREQGHVFRSASDSETLVHLYEEHGAACVEHVNGMFAFALWDERSRTLVAAVDRLGKKPLYWCAEGGKLALASEMKSLLQLPWVRRDVDPLAVDRYLTFRYVPPPLSILKHVRKLAPAHLLIWRDGEVSVREYWRPERRETMEYGPDAVDAFEELFGDAVGIRMQSDVPLGVYLSGGVDSSAVAGMMRRLEPEGRRVSFTVSIDYKHDERERAQKIADHLGYEFNPVTVANDDFDLLPRIAWHLDEPFGDLLCIPAYLLPQHTKKQLTVTLTGDGADEIFNGYFHQKLMMMWRRMGPLFGTPGAGPVLSTALSAIPATALNAFFDYPDRLGVHEKRKLAYALRHCRSFGGFYEGITSCFNGEVKAELYGPDMARVAQQSPVAREFDQIMETQSDFSYLSRLSLLDLKYWVPFSTLFRLDKLSMAHAVETRSPFLDYRVVEFALNLADDAKLGRRNKEIVRALIDRLYPPSLREKGKQAFYMPLSPQYRARFKAWAQSLLTRQSVEHRGLFRWEAVQRLLQDFDAGSMLVNRQLMGLATLELWFRVCLDKPLEKQ